MKKTLIVLTMVSAFGLLVGTTYADNNGFGMLAGSASNNLSQSNGPIYVL